MNTTLLGRAFAGAVLSLLLLDLATTPVSADPVPSAPAAVAPH